MREYWKKHAEHINERRQERYRTDKKHRAFILEQQRQRYARNIEHRREYCRNYYAENREKYLIMQRRWRNKNHLALNILHHNRRARMNGNGGSHTLKELIDLFDRQQGSCYYCGNILEYNVMHRDHKTPVSRGGTNDIGNIAWACARCNNEKFTMTEPEYNTRRGG